MLKKIPEFLPDEQQNYLRKLQCKANDSTSKIVYNTIIIVIEATETQCKGLGQEILKGAHIMLQTNSTTNNSTAAFNEFIKNTENRDRYSSHHKDCKIEEKGIGIKATGLEFLLGRNNDDTVWMQLERNKVSLNDGYIIGIIRFICHMINYMEYKFTNQNIGPCGRSQYVESTAIILNAQEVINSLYAYILPKASSTIEDLYAKTSSIFLQGIQETEAVIFDAEKFLQTSCNEIKSMCSQIKRFSAIKSSSSYQRK